MTKLIPRNSQRYRFKVSRDEFNKAQILSKFGWKKYANANGHIYMQYPGMKYYWQPEVIYRYILPGVLPDAQSISQDDLRNLRKDTENFWASQKSRLEKNGWHAAQKDGKTWWWPRAISKGHPLNVAALMLDPDTNTDDYLISDEFDDWTPFFNWDFGIHDGLLLRKSRGLLDYQQQQKSETKQQNLKPSQQQQESNRVESSKQNQQQDTSIFAKKSNIDVIKPYTLVSDVFINGTSKQKLQSSKESPKQKLQPRRETDFHKAWREARDMGLDTFNWRRKLYTTRGVTDTGEEESIDEWKNYLANRKQRQSLSFPIPTIEE